MAASQTVRRLFRWPFRRSQPLDRPSPFLAGRRWRRLELERLEDRLAPVSGLGVLWDGGGGTSDWNNALNWSTDQVPGASDDVIIDVPGNITVNLAAGSRTVKSLMNAETLAISGGATLTLAAASENRGTLTVTSATLGGAGSLANVEESSTTFHNATVDVALNNRSTLRTRGTTRLNGAVTTSATSQILIEGQIGAFNGDLIVGQGFTNNGLINLTRLSGCCDNNAASLTVSSGTLTNAPAATLRVSAGTGGPRSLNLQLDNQGSFDIQTAVTWTRTSATHVNSGTIQVAGGDLTLTQSGTTPTFTNRGTINLASSRTFTVNGGTFHLEAGTISGAGIWSVQNATLEVTPAFDTGVLGGLNLISSIWNSANTLTGSASSLVLRQSTINAPFTSSGTVRVRGTTRLNGTVTTETTSQIMVEGQIGAFNGDLVVDKSFTNHGLIDLTRLAGCCDDNAASLTVNTGTFINAADGTLRVSAGTGGPRTLSLQLDNQGTLEIQAAVTLTKASAAHVNTGVINLIGGDLTLNQSGTAPIFTNRGTITLGSGRTFTVNGGSFNLEAGSLAGPGNWTLNNATVTATPAYDVGAIGNLNLTTSTWNSANLLTVSANNLLLRQSTINAPFANSGIVRVRGTTQLKGDVTTTATSQILIEAQIGAFNGDLIVDKGFTNHGLIDLTRLAGCCDNNASSMTVSTGALTNAPTGTLRLSAGTGGPRTLNLQLDNQGTFDIQTAATWTRPSATHVNAGQIIVGGGNLTLTQSGTGASFTNKGTIRIDPGRTLQITNGIVTNAAGGVLTGTGTVGLTGTSLTNAGSIRPGNPVGALTIAGSLSQTTTGVIDLDIGGLAAGTQHDRLVVAGAAALGGTLKVGLTNGFHPEAGAVVTPLTFGSRSGDFATTVGLEYSPTASFIPSYTATALQLTAQESTQQLGTQLRDGFAAVASQLPMWGRIFNLSSVNLPVIPETLDSLFAIRDQLAALELPTIPGQADLEQLRASLAAAGFVIECYPGGSGCSSDDRIQVRYSTTLVNLTAAAEFDDSTLGLLQDLAAAANLNGNLNLTAALGVTLIVGVDRTGFYLRGDSGLILTMTGGGTVTTQFALTGNLGVAATGGARLAPEGMMVALTGTPQRLRDLPQFDGSFLVPTANGKADISLDLNLTGLNLPWEGDWALTVTNNVVSGTANVQFPCEDDLIAAFLPFVTTQFETLFGPEVINALNRIQLPFANDQGPRTPAPNQAVGLNATKEPQWFTAVVGYLQKLLDLGGIQKVDGTYRFKGQGPTYSLGAELLGALAIRKDPMLKLDGTGIRIGVISDGVDALEAVFRGKNPEIPEARFHVNHDFSGGPLPGSTNPGRGNEGIAMAEIIFDIVPKAEVYFSGVGLPPGANPDDGVAAFLGALDYFRKNNVQIIVEDVEFFQEPWFEMGTIAQAVQQLVADDKILFITAAGNNNGKHYRSQFDPYPDMSGDEAIFLHQFIPGQPYLPITIPPGETFRVDLQWSQPFLTPSAAFEISIIDSVTRMNLGTSASSEANRPAQRTVSVTNPGATPLRVSVVVFTNSDPVHQPELDVVSLSLLSSIPLGYYSTGSNQLSVNAAIKDVLTVGAIDLAEVDKLTRLPGAPLLDANAPAPDSSIGPARLLDGIVVPGPDLLGTAGVRVSGAGGFPKTFFGTSAAAPHLAGIAAQLLQYRPGTPPSKLIEALVDSATDLDGLPVAAPDVYLLNGSTLVVTPLTNDYDRDWKLTEPDQPLKLIKVDQPFQGTITELDSEAGTYLYTAPTTATSPEDVFTYTLEDSRGNRTTGFVTIHLNPTHYIAVPDHLVTTQGQAITFPVLNNDLLATGAVILPLTPGTEIAGTMTRSGNELTFTPYPNFVGSAGQFTYQVRAGGVTYDAIAILEVVAPHIRPGTDEATGAGRVNAVGALAELAKLPAPMRSKQINLLADEEVVDFRDMLASIGIEIEHLVTCEQLIDLLTGRTTDVGDLLRLRATSTALEFTPLLADFGADLDDVGGLAGANLAGTVHAEARPGYDIRFGFDTKGFFLGSDTSVFADLSGTVAANGSFAGLSAEATGSLGLRATLGFAGTDQDGDGRIRLDEFTSAAGTLQTAISNAHGQLTLGLASDLLDYVDADGDATNNTSHGGDPFRFVASVGVEQAGTGFRYTGIDLKNPDVNGDGQQDFTSAVLIENMRRLAQDVVRGNRTVLQGDLVAALNAQLAPLTNTPLGTALQVSQKLADFLLTNTEVLHVVEFDTLESWLNHGLPETTQELIRFSVDLDAIPLTALDNLQFDLSKILPDTPNTLGLAGLQNAQLAGQLVFGLDTADRPLYLLVQPDLIRPEAVTTLGGAFDVFVNLTGQPFANDLLTFGATEARLRNGITVGLTGPADGKLRLDGSLISNLGLTLSGGAELQLDAHDVHLLPGQDNPLFRTSLNSLRGTINIATGKAELLANNVEVQIGAALKLTASGFEVSFDPSAQAEKTTAAILMGVLIEFPTLDHAPVGSVEQIDVQYTRSTDTFTLGLTNVVVKPDEATPHTAMVFENLLEIRNPELVANVTITVAPDATTVTGDVAVRADSAILFPDVTTSAADGVLTATGVTEETSVTGQLDLATGALSLQAGRVTLDLGDALVVTASGNDTSPALEFFLDPGQTDPAAEIATVRNVKIDVPAFSDWPADLTTLDLLTIRRNGFTVAKTFGAPTPLDLTLGDAPEILRIDDLTADILVDVTFHDDPLTNTTITGRIDVTAAEARLFPDQPFGATISDDNPEDTLPALQGSLDLATGKLDVTARRVQASLAGVLTITATGPTLHYDPQAPGSAVLLEMPGVEARLEGLAAGSSVPTATLADFGFRQNGQAFASEATFMIPTGYAKALGIAGLLPLEIQALRATFPDPDNLNAFVLEAQGRFNIEAIDNQLDALFGSDVTPVIHIGDPAQIGQPNSLVQSYRSGQNGNLTFSINVASLKDGQAEPVNLGPITLGLLGVQVRGLSFDGLITLGGYQNGVLIPRVSGFFKIVGDDPGTTDDDRFLDAQLTIQAGSTLRIENGRFILDVAARAAISGSGGGSSVEDLTLTFGLLVEATQLDVAPFIRLDRFEPRFESLSLGELVINIGNFLRLTAREVTFLSNPQPGQPIADLDEVQVEFLTVPQLQAGVIHDLKLFDDEGVANDRSVEIGSIQVGLSGPIDSLLELVGLKLSTFNLIVNLDTGAFNADGIQLTVDSARLLPNGTNARATIDGLKANFSSSGQLEWSATRVNASLGDVIQVQAVQPHFNFGESAPDPLFSVDAVVATVPSLNNLQIDFTNFALSRTGRFSLSTAQVRSDGFLRTIGLGDLLPFDITRVAVEFPNKNDLDTFFITAAGTFNFAGLNLPFTPIVQIGGTDPNNPPGTDFAFKLRVASLKDGKVLPETIGPITLGFSDLDVGEITLGATITLGGYQNGSFVPQIGASLSVLRGISSAEGNDSSDGFQLQGFEFTLNGTYLPASANNGVTRLEVTVAGGVKFRLALGDFLKLSGFNFRFGLTLTEDAQQPGFQITVTPVLNSIGVDAVRMKFGELFQLEATNVVFNFTREPGQPLAVLGEISLTIPSLQGIGGTVQNLEIKEGGIPDFGAIQGVQLAFGDVLKNAFQFLPVTVDKLGFKFKDELFHRDASGNIIGLKDPTQVILVFSGGVGSSRGSSGQVTWPFSATVQNVELDISKLVRGEFPVTRLDGFRLGIEPIELVPNFIIGGFLEFGILTNVKRKDGTSKDVLYGRIIGEFKFQDVGAKVELVVSEFGPLAANLKVPLAIPIAQTGFIISGVEGSLQFGRDLLPTRITDPREILDIPNPLRLDFGNEAVLRSFIEPAVFAETFTWEQAFTIAFAGTMTHLAAAGTISGTVTLAANIGLSGPDAGLKLLGFGNLDVLGLPVGQATMLLDLRDPIAPTLGFGFQMPVPDNILGFLLPARVEFSALLSTKGLALSAATGLHAFVDKLVNGAVDVAGELLFNPVLDKIAQRLNEKMNPVLARLLRPDLDNRPTSQFPFTRQEITDALLDLLDLDFSATDLTVKLKKAAELTNAFSIELFAVTGEVLTQIQADAEGDLAKVRERTGLTNGPTPAGFEAFVANILDPAKTQTGTVARELVVDAMTALLGIFKEAAFAAIDEVVDVVMNDDLFDPIFSVRGQIQPVIFGIPLPPDGELQLTVSKKGLIFGGQVSITKLSQRLAAVTSPIGIIALIPLPVTDRIETSIRFPFADDVPQQIATALKTLLEGRLPVANINPISDQWAVTFQGFVDVLGYQIGQLGGLAFPARATDLLTANIQKLYGPNAGDDVQPSKIPITEERFYEAMLTHGGFLINGQLTAPQLITDPIAVIGALQGLPDPLTNPGTFFDRLVTILGSIEPVARAQLFVPSFQDLLVFNFDSPNVESPGDTPPAGEAARPRVQAGVGIDQAKLNERINAAFFDGVFNGKLLSIQLAQARVRGTADELTIIGSVPWLAGLEATFQLKNETRQSGAVSVKFPTVSASASIDTERPTGGVSEYERILAGLGLPSRLFQMPANARAEFRAFSPAFKLDSKDVLQVKGGVGFNGELRIDGLLDKAAFDFQITPPAANNLVPDFKAIATVQNLTLPGLANNDLLKLTNFDVTLTKEGNRLTGDLTGHLILFGNDLTAAGQVEMSSEGMYGVFQVDAHNFRDFGSQFNFKINGTLFVHLNTTGSEKTVTLAGIGVVKLAPGARVVVENGSLEVGGFKLTGHFELQVSGSGLSVVSDAKLKLFDRITLDADGSLEIRREGNTTGILIDVVLNTEGAGAVSGGTLPRLAVVPAGLGFALNASFALQVSTFTTPITSARGTTFTQPTFQVHAAGDLQITNATAKQDVFKLTGTFDVSLVSGGFSVKPAASLELFGTQLTTGGTLTVLTGSATAANNGLVANMELTVAGGGVLNASNTLGFTLGGTFRLQVNTTNSAYDGVPKQTFQVKVSNATLQFQEAGANRFAITNGTFEVTISSEGFAMKASGKVKLFETELTVTAANLRVITNRTGAENGIVVFTNLTLPATAPLDALVGSTKLGFTLSGIFQLVVNTTNQYSGDRNNNQQKDLGEAEFVSPQQFRLDVLLATLQLKQEDGNASTDDNRFKLQGNFSLEVSPTKTMMSFSGGSIEILGQARPLTTNASITVFTETGIFGRRGVDFSFNLGAQIEPAAAKAGTSNLGFDVGGNFSVRVNGTNRPAPDGVPAGTFQFSITQATVRLTDSFELKEGTLTGSVSPSGLALTLDARTMVFGSAGPQLRGALTVHTGNDPGITGSLTSDTESATLDTTWFDLRGRFTLDINTRRGGKSIVDVSNLKFDMLGFTFTGGITITVGAGVAKVETKPGQPLRARLFDVLDTSFSGFADSNGNVDFTSSGSFGAAAAGIGSANVSGTLRIKNTGGSGPVLTGEFSGSGELFGFEVGSVTGKLDGAGCFRCAASALGFELPPAAFSLKTAACDLSFQVVPLSRGITENNAGHNTKVEITVLRQGRLDLPASVRVRTQDGGSGSRATAGTSSSNGADYAPLDTRLTFAANASSATLFLNVFGDNNFNDAAREVFQIVLDDPQLNDKPAGGFLDAAGNSTQSLTLTATIVDDDQKLNPTFGAIVLYDFDPAQGPLQLTPSFVLQDAKGTILATASPIKLVTGSRVLAERELADPQKFTNLPQTSRAPTGGQAGAANWPRPVLITDLSQLGSGSSQSLPGVQGIRTSGPLPGTATTKSYTTEKYFEITIAPRERISLTQLSFKDARVPGSSGDTGPKRWEVRSSLDGFRNALASGDTHGSELTLNTIPFNYSCVLAPITFRIYAYDASDKEGVWVIDDVKVGGGACKEYAIGPRPQDDLVALPPGFGSILKQLDIRVTANDLSYQVTEEDTTAKILDAVRVLEVAPPSIGTAQIVTSGGVNQVRYSQSGAVPYQVTVPMLYTVTDASGLRSYATLYVQFTPFPVPPIGKLKVTNSAVAGAGIFFDANRNGVPDFLDHNQNGIQDEGEPAEPVTITTADGSSDIPFDLRFDTNGNGQPDPTEGQFVAFGGTNTATTLPLLGQLRAPAGARMITPLTTLVLAVSEERGISYEEAQILVQHRWAMPAVDLRQFDTVAEIRGGNPTGPEVYAWTIKWQSTVMQLARLLEIPSGRSTSDTISSITRAAARLLVEPSGQFLLGEPSFVARLIRVSAEELGFGLEEHNVLAAAEVVAFANRRIDAIPRQANARFLDDILRIETVAQAKNGLALAQAGVGMFTDTSWTYHFTYEAFENLLRAVTLGTIAPGLPSTIVATGAEAGQDPLVRVFDVRTKAERFSFLAYDPLFRGGVRVALGDVNGDGILDIATAAGPGGGPHVRVFDGQTGQQLPEPIGSFMAFDASLRSGIQIAAGDVNGDGRADLIVTPDFGADPRVLVFDARNGLLIHDFLAYDVRFRGGVRVAAGDLNGDGRTEIVTGAGPSGAPHVRVFDAVTLAEMASFLAYDIGFTGGVNLALGDVDGDGKLDLVTGAGAGGGAHVKVFSGGFGPTISSFLASEYVQNLAFLAGDLQHFFPGARVGVADLDGDGRADVITTADQRRRDALRVWNALTANEIDRFFASGQAFEGGLLLATS